MVNVCDADVVTLNQIIFFSLVRILLVSYSVFFGVAARTGFYVIGASVIKELRLIIQFKTSPIIHPKSEVLIL